MTGADVPPEEQDHGEDGPYLFCHDCGVFGTDPCRNVIKRGDYFLL